jgi:hypothetical protein
MVGLVDAAKGRHSVDAKRDEADHPRAMYSPFQQKVTTILRLLHKVTKTLRNFRCNKNNLADSTPKCNRPY